MVVSDVIHLNGVEHWMDGGVCEGIRAGLEGASREPVFRGSVNPSFVLKTW